MVKLKVAYEGGGGVFERTVFVADDEEYWFENSGTPDCSLNVGKRHLAPWNREAWAEEETKKLPPGQWAVYGPRLHIFNLVLVEVAA